jgi:hypothetical protein
MSKPYHMLLVREDGQWSPQFGDFDRDCVVQEREDTYLARWRGDEMRYAAKDIKIVKLVDSSPRALQDTLATLNRRY